MAGVLAAIAALGIPLWMLRVTSAELENAIQISETRSASETVDLTCTKALA